MNGKLAGILAIFFIALGLTMLACSDSGTESIEEAAPELSTVYPSDGSQDIPVNSHLHIRFNTPMDTQSVRMNMFLSGGEPMHEWMDSLDHYGGMGHMGMGRHNRMVGWMDSIQWGGGFHWNGNLDSCEFIPDSNLMPGTEYMIMIQEDSIMGRHGQYMNHDHMGAGYHYYRFTTEQ